MGDIRRLEAHRKISKRYYEKHKEDILQKRREYNKTLKRKQYMKDYVVNNKNKIKQRALEVKRQVLTYYGGGSLRCVCCGESHIEFLTIDHVKGGGRAHLRSITKEQGRKGGVAFYRWLRKHGFPEGYRTLCFNCNCAIGHFGYCPHQKEKKI